LDSKEFVAQLVAEMEQLFGHLGETDTLSRVRVKSTSSPAPPGLKAKWRRASSPAPAFQHSRDGRQMIPALQCGDEMKHYGMISERLAELGGDAAAIDPLADGWRPLPVPPGPADNRADRRRPLRQRGHRRVTTRSSCPSAARWGTRRRPPLADTIQPEVHHYELGRGTWSRHPELQELTAAAVRASPSPTSCATWPPRPRGSHPGVLKKRARSPPRFPF
jgi:hypothetical protein